MLNGGTDGQSTAAPESSLADDISSLFGDDFSSRESPESEGQSAGAPPAQGEPETPDTAQASSEGESTAEHAGAPPADAATPPATPDDAVPADDDPLAGAEPFTYTVNGQQRTFDGLTKLGDRGAIVTADALTKLQQRLSERDNLFERQQEQYQKYAALEESFNKLTQWSVGKDQQTGQERILTGADAVQAQRVMLGRSVATLQVLAKALDDPEQFARLVSVVDDGQGGLAIVPDRHAIEHLKTLADNAAMRAEQSVAQHFAGLRSSLKAVPQTPVPEAPQASTATIEPAAALESVKGFAAQMDAKGLTAEDEAFLAESLPRYVRPATAEERAQYNSSTVVDISFGKLIQRTAQMRASVATTASAASQATKENERKLAAAATGIRPKAPPAPRTPAPAPKQQSDADKAWDLQERLVSGRLGA